MTPEGKVKKLVKDLLAEYHIQEAKDAGGDGDWQGWYYMPSQNGYGVKGIPDFAGHYKGAFWAIETKKPGESPEGFQLLQLDAIRKSGGAQFIVDGVESLKAFQRWLNSK